MAESIKYYGDLELFGNMTFARIVNEFPANPALGTLILKETVLYAYLKIGDLETWFPFANGTNSYIHTQGLAAQTWTVNHSLGTANVWYQVRDNLGNIIAVGKTDLSDNAFTLNFTTPVIGTCVVVAPDSINVPEVKASSITIGTQNVVIDTSGVRINGSYAPTTAVMDSQIATAVNAETTRATAAEGTLASLTTTTKDNLVAAINEVKASAATGIAAKAPTDSPSFTGTPLADTAPPGTDSTQLATTAFVQNAISTLAQTLTFTLDELIGV